jgi:PST family polysaccharide transporter
VPEPGEEARPTSAKRGGAITVGGQLIKMVVQFAGLVAYSHLLTPREVGLIAMLTVFIALGDLIRDFGLSQAAIQTAKLTQGQASNLFWSNTLIGIALTAALILGSPAVADMYSEPALRSLAPWVAVSFIMTGIQTQFQVRLARDLRFVALTTTDAASQLIGLIAGLIGAMNGAGPWSLVIQMLVVYGSLLVQRAAIAGWWPGRPRREPGMGALYMFGLQSGLANLLHYIAYNTDSYIIGIRWGASALGVYNRAFNMFTVPAGQLLAPLINVALPIMSRRRHEGGDFYPLLWKAQVAISATLTMLFAVVAAAAKPIVHIVLGPQWAEAATLLSILSIGGAVQILSNMAFWAFLASGNTRQLLLSGLVTRSQLAACTALGSLGGLEGVAWGFTTGLSISWFISLAWLKRCDAMPVSQFLRSGLHVVGCGLLSGAAGWVLVRNFDSRLSPVVLLIAVVVLVSSIYVPLLLLNAKTRGLLVETIGPTFVRVKGLLRKEVRRG